MRLRRIAVTHFGCIEAAEVEFGPGLNVLYGPNDLGKTTLASAIRAALLLVPNSTAAQEFRAWQGDSDPQVVLTFEHGGRYWRVEKTWSTSSTRRQAALYGSSDGQTFTLDEEARGVDGKLRDLLGWGVSSPGGRGGTRGLPRSFLASVLLGEQAQPYGVFDLSLAEDADDSAKTKLRAALEAIAVDPLYERVLQSSQAKVSEAFTDRGARSTRRDSPFRRVAEEVKRRIEAAEAWEKRHSESEAVELRLADLDAERERWMSARAEAVEVRDRLQRDFERAQARTRVQERWTPAKARVEEIGELRAAIEALEAEERTAQEALSVQRGALEEAQAGLRNAEDRWTRSAAHVHQLREGGTAAQQVEIRTLEQRKYEQAAALRDLDARHLQLEEARRHADALQATARAQAEYARAIEAKTAEVRQTEQALSDALDEQQRVERCLAWYRYEEARLAAQEAADARAEIEQREAEVKALHERAASLRHAQRERDLPLGDAFERLKQIVAQRDLARASLGGGLALRLAWETAVPGASLVLDDTDTPVTHEAGPTALEIQRGFDLVLPGIVTLSVRAGEKSVRHAWEAAEQAFQTQVRPVLERTGHPDIAALELEVRRAQAVLQEAEALDDRASTLLERSASRAPLAAMLEARLARAQTLLAVLGDIARESVARDAETRSEHAWQNAAAAQPGIVEERRRVATRAREALTRLEAEARATEQQALRAQEALGALLMTHGLENREALEQAQQRHADQRGSLEAQLRCTEQALRDLQAQHERSLADAGEALTAAEAERARARAHLDEVERRVKQIDDRLSQGRGAIKTQRERLGRIDVMAAAEAFALVNDELERCEAPELAVDAAMIEHAQQEIARLEHLLEGVDTEFRQQQGALAQLGGEVVRERARLAREALERAQREETEVELDYEAWRLLHATLREAENHEGLHVGRVLARDIAERFGGLTRGRYGSLALGPELQTLGLGTETGLKPVSALSEGLKEQLATLLRISVAEHLQGALLLDDHLAQTDPSRVAWFRELLRNRGCVTQILLMTCRPLEYLSELELPAEAPILDVAPHMRVIDLSRLIHRCG